ncbi:MAG: hypothetical protein Fur0011_3320 [Candidatus Microgenomates bacterium]
MIAHEAKELNYSPPPINSPIPDFFPANPQNKINKPGRPFTQETLLVEINKRTFRCDLIDPDGTRTDSIYCVLKENEDGSLIVSMSLKDIKNHKPHLAVARIADSNHIAILFAGSEYGRTDWLCRYDTLSDTLFYPEFQPENSLIENVKDQQGNPLTIEAKTAIQEACFAATLEPVTIPINGRNVKIQPDSRGYIAIFETIPNPVDPSNPTVLIKSDYVDLSGNHQTRTLLALDLSTMLQSLAVQEQTISGIPLHLPDPNLPLPSLTLPDRVINAFNYANPTFWESAKIGIGTTKKDTSITPPHTPTPNADGLILPKQETNPTNFEPSRIVEADGTTNHLITANFSCPIDTNVTIFSTNIDSPLAAQIRYEISTSHTYRPAFINELGQKLRDEAGQYNSKLPIWLKKIFGLNTTVPYKIERCKSEGVNKTFQLLYKNLDNNSNVTFFGFDPTNQELIYFTLKAKNVNKYLTVKASVQGIPDPAMTNELLRQNSVLRINKYGKINRGTVMIPANSIPNLPKDTNLANLTYYAEIKHYGKSYPAILIDQSGHEHNLLLPSGIPMREITTKYQDGTYIVTLEADIINYVSQLDPSTYQAIIDIYGHLPERLLLQYPLIDLYTSYTSPIFFNPTPTPTPTPSSPRSQLEIIKKQQTTLKLHICRQQSLIHAQQKKYPHKGPKV